MNIQKIKEQLEIICPGKVEENAPMARHTSFKAGGNADLLVTPGSVDELKKSHLRGSVLHSHAVGRKQRVVGPPRIFADFGLWRQMRV